MTADRTRASLELLFDIGRELASSLDLRTVLDRVIALSIDNVGAERGSLIVLDENREPLTASVIHNGKSPRLNNIKQPNDLLDHGLAGWVIKSGQSVLIEDTSKDERWLHRPDDSIDRTGPKSAICVPLVTRERMVGVLTMVYPTPDHFNKDSLALLQAIADLAAIAVQNALLYDSLQAAHQRYYELFEDSIYPILITDWEGNILEVNRMAAQASASKTEDLIGRAVWGFQGVAKDAFDENYKKLKEDKTVEYGSTFLRQDGTTFPAEIYIRKINFEGADSLQWIIRDITERKELDSLREDLAAMIYHDLRSPLSNIISSLDILGTMLPIETSPSIRSVFQITNRSADRMQRLISSLLDINRLETGQPIANRKTVSVLELAQEAREVVLPTLESKQQIITTRFPDELPPVYVDTDMIRRVLINLLENAIKFTPMKGAIELGGREEGKWIYLWVTDNGPGIAPEAQEKIFEKFTRLKTENAPKGVGLGLAFCKLAVTAHGGRIWVESQLGSGSRFIFTLPVKESGQLVLNSA
jgi:PAS domain S-box-containing protein